MTSRYNPVRDGSPAAPQPVDLTPVPRLEGRVPAAVVERISTKVQAALWVIAAVVIFVKGGVYEVASDPARSNPFFVYLGLAALALTVVLAFYCVVWIPRVHYSQWGWAVVAPGMVEAATAAVVTSFFSFIIGLWPGYGLLTPLIVGFEAMGCVFVLHFIPFS